ncbi:glycosyltransferase [Pedobacter caeni]|uniref:Glycosyl transferase family 2 n=1 Tax=Pedobacter caeni TaxID=288992 RepID=A0A1M5H363_9SPHI|nr:glycosyltransferase [Pedobacter caeni]SHG10345.1 Glycosyl transferase family 2 [Pedobacter caeni]
MNSKHPLISCICLTWNNEANLQRALVCFKGQDYPNTELIIAYPDNDNKTRSILDQIMNISPMRIIRIEHPKQENRITTKNNAINMANGSFICMWKDEHWHHVNRISDQYRVIRNTPFLSSVLMHILIFNVKNQQTFHSGYRPWQDTLFCEKQMMLQASYTKIEREDDSVVIDFLSYHNKLYHITETPHLYVLIYYGNKHYKQSNSYNYFLKSEFTPEINQTVKELINPDHYAMNNQNWDI